MRVSSFLPLAPLWALATSSPIAAGAVCPQTHGSNITVTSGSATYVMSVPANKTQFSVVGPDQQLGCVQLDGKYSMCLPCNFPVNKLEVTSEAGVCSFNISGHTNLLYNQYWGGSVTISPPAQILDVECGLPWQGLPPPSSTPSTAVFARDNGLATRPALAQRDTKLAAPSSADSNCPASADWKVVVTTTDGHIYFAPLPLDIHYHSASSMHCVRLADAACVPCDEIGPAVGVSTRVKWGPCDFTFDNSVHEAVNTPYLDKNLNDENSLVIPTVWFPPATIAGMECGTA